MLLDAELALDRLRAELASELPSTMRAFAAAHAANRAPPAGPAATRRLAIALRALAHPELAELAVPIVRLLAPIAIDEDPSVTAALRREPRDWDALATLVRARDAAAKALFGCRYLELVHRLYGVDLVATTTPRPPPIDGWLEPGEGVPSTELAALCQRLAVQYGLRGALRVAPVADPTVRPRAFVVDAREVIVVVPAQLATPADRFAAIHELGHAVASLLIGAPLPRVVDEAAAAFIARLVEDRAERWYSPLAAAARGRRRALAAMLDHIERSLPDLANPPTPLPPWALWHDSAAQAAYVAAEDLADRWWQDLGARPGPERFSRALRAATAVADAVTVGGGIDRR